jgi:SAM-dependent methyltransferase
LSPRSALAVWREALASWALPEEILAKAPQSPWTYPWELFRRRAEAALDAEPSPSARRALEALRAGGSVTDVGSGPGAASLALARRAGRITAVDQSEEALQVFDEIAAHVGVGHGVVVGTWPDVADRVDPADVVVCNHVFYNVPDLEPFVRALTEHARRRVVVEVTAEHPRADENDLWKRFHGLDRPTRPTADDAEQALVELGLHPGREDWSTPRPNEPRDEIITRLRIELGLTPDRDDEIAEAVRDRLVERDDGWSFGDERRLVTLWWEVGLR